MMPRMPRKSAEWVMRRLYGGTRQMTKYLKRLQIFAVGASVVVCSASLGGCGGLDGVELNGKIFDALGVGGDPFAKRPEPKTQARAPLVLPPDASKLPEPGSQPTAGAPIVTGAVDSAWPRDRDAIKAADAEAKKQAKDNHCKDGNWKERSKQQGGGHSDSSCTGSIFSVVGDQLFGSSEK